MPWLLALVAAGVGVLAIPIDVSFEGVLGGTSHARVAWLFGLMKRDLRRPPSRKTGASKPRRQGGSLRRLLAMARSPGFLAGALRCGRRCLGAFKIRALTAHLVLGLDDPADTGMVFAFVEALRASLGVARREGLELLPDYLESGLRGQAAGALRVSPLRLVFEGLRFLGSASTLRAFVAASRA